ncbi:MAG: tetratricopeptide repeat protein [Proteobacteria bacterium]|nr:tetratricopeptide repeat protein [Pseudomonadota bacterium]
MNETSIDELLKQGFYQHKRGNFTLAKQHYLNILQKEPKHIEAMHLLGMLCAQTNEYTEAVSWLEKTISFDSENPLFHNHLGNAYKGLKQYALAEKHYLKSLELNPKYAEAHNNLAGLYYLQEDYAKALQHYYFSLKAKPDYVEAHSNLGLLFMKQGKLKEAEKQFQNVLKLNPNSLMAHYQLGNLYLHKGKYNLAEKQYYLVLSWNPEHIEALNNMGVLSLKQKKPQEAIEYFTKVLILNEHHLEARSNIAATFLHFDRFENAITQYYELLKLDPNYPNVQYNLGVAFMSLGRLSEAIQSFQKAILENPKDANAHTNLATIYIKLHDIEKAKQYFKESLRINPTDESVKFMLNALTHEHDYKKTPIQYVANLFDNYAVQYEQHLTIQLQYRLPVEFKRALSELTDFPKLKWRILDLGCGTGLSGEVFKDSAKYLLGVDLSSKMLKIARDKKLYNRLFEQGIQEFLLENRDKFDLIIAADVFNYVGDLKEIFQEIKPRLTDSGLFIFSVEKTSQYPYLLETTARFSHHEKYIRELCQQFGLNILLCKEVVARIQDNQPVLENIFICG